MNQNLKNIPQGQDTASAIVMALDVIVWGGCQPKTGIWR